MSARERDGLTIHDHGIVDPAGCPRGCTNCAPLARYASEGMESFMCCGETSAAPVPTDRLRLCIKSTHEHGVDLLVNFDERDAVHTSSVLLAGLSALGSVEIIASAAAGALPVHNHGPEEGPGLACCERIIDGRLVGDCLAAARATPAGGTEP